jgi:hypothetical protein
MQTLLCVKALHEHQLPGNMHSSKRDEARRPRVSTYRDVHGRYGCPYSGHPGPVTRAAPSSSGRRSPRGGTRNVPPPARPAQRAAHAIDVSLCQRDTGTPKPSQYHGNARMSSALPARAMRPFLAPPLSSYAYSYLTPACPDPHRARRPPTCRPPHPSRRQTTAAARAPRAPPACRTPSAA